MTINNDRLAKLFEYKLKNHNNIVDYQKIAPARAKARALKSPPKLKKNKREKREKSKKD